MQAEQASNHLGNVLAVITDRKHGEAASGTEIQWFDADVVSAQQYYPFGMLMPDTTNVGLRRQYTVAGNDYRYGFNGKEGDDEVKGDDNQQDYGMRIYDPRVGRFLSVDPIGSKYPDLSPFAFAGNSVIWLNDKNGQEPTLEPDRNQAGTIEQAVSQWRAKGLTTAKDIKIFIQREQDAIRYVYTKDKGWIDLQHYFGTLYYGKTAMDALEPASGEYFLQETVLGKGANESYFSYEDLPSNQFAADSKNLTEDYWISGKDEFLIKKTRQKTGENLIKSVLENFIEVQATLPTEAPNWKQIPFKDHGERMRLPEPVRYPSDGSFFPIAEYTNSQLEDFLKSGKYIPQNKTGKPYNLSNFPPAPSSLEKGDTKKGATGY